MCSRRFRRRSRRFQRVLGFVEIFRFSRGFEGVTGAYHGVPCVEYQLLALEDFNDFSGGSEGSGGATDALWSSRSFQGRSKISVVFQGCSSGCNRCNRRFNGVSRASQWCSRGFLFYFMRFSGDLRSFRGCHGCSVGFQGLQRGSTGFQEFHMVSRRFQGRYGDSSKEFQRVSEVFTTNQEQEHHLPVDFLGFSEWPWSSKKFRRRSRWF